MLLPPLHHYSARKRKHWPLLLLPVSALGLLAAVIYPQRVVAPLIETPYTRPPQVPAVRSLDDLYQLRDRLRAELDQPGSVPSLTASGAFSTPTVTLQMLQAVEIRIEVERQREQTGTKRFKHRSKLKC